MKFRKFPPRDVVSSYSTRMGFGESVSEDVDALFTAQLPAASLGSFRRRDVPQPPPQLLHHKMPVNNYRMVIASLPSPPNPLIQNMNPVHAKLSPRHVVIRPPYQPNNPSVMNAGNLNLMSPLNVNVGSPMYSLPSSPNYSPVMSPAQKERIISPYPTPPQSLSPVGNYYVNKAPPNRALQTTKDPFLTNKMQVSPGLPQIQRNNDVLLDSTIETPDFWMDSEFLQGTADLLTALELA
ncbi:hypothetical protein EVAR_53805_1 [Eumeta japonica]|uniref:Uncharacterized protein n=1 Tax=Eumeta variegata TaxID=151549 RepID=A0A4C1XZS2_EUMVA|nr:hypothetical protein EVAR_53805_1 [Eumeta japonica]